jgi:uncharacterized protein involved in cysteine biosynthesis
MHGSPIEALLGPLAAAFLKFVAIVVLLLAAMAMVLLDLLVGGLLLAVLQRKRFLFLLLPPINFALYLLALPALAWWLWEEEIAVVEHFRFPLANLTLLALPTLALLGWLSAGMLAPVQVMLRWLWDPVADRPGDDPSLADYLAQPAAATRWQAYREGLAAPRRGFAYLCYHPRLWRYAVTPILLNVLITAFALFLFLAAVAYFATYLHPQFPSGWGWLLLEIACALLLLLVALGLTWATWLLLQAILCGHFFGKLARQVEIQLGADPAELEEPPLASQVVDALIDLSLLLAINLGLLFLNLVPVLGSLAAAGGSFAFDCYLFGAGYLDFPLGLRGWRRRERRQFTRRFRYHTLGLGTVVFLVTLIPLAGAVVLATAVVGAVLLHRRLQWLDAGMKAVSQE